MNNNRTHHFKPKVTRQENFLTLKRAIDNDSIEYLVEFNKKWGGAYVIVTSNPKMVFNPETDEDDWFGHRSSATYVLTQNAVILSKFLRFIDCNVMASQDNYLFGFIALLANDFIRQLGHLKDSKPILEYLFSGVSFYLSFYDWENGMGNSKKAFEFMRFFLSENISDDEIRHIL